MRQQKYRTRCWKRRLDISFKLSYFDYLHKNPKESLKKFLELLDDFKVLWNKRSVYPPPKKNPCTNIYHNEELEIEILKITIYSISPTNETI